MTAQDQALIALLAANARESTASLARKLGLSRTTVQERIHRLERGGVIRGYTVRLAERSSAQVSAQVLLNVNPKRTTEVVRNLAAMPHCAALHAVSGVFDYVVTVGAASTEELDRCLDRIGDLAGIERTQTLVVLSTKFER
ncbi:MAG: Lrp/AsnC family transcriptional regulator [Casimicrobiaceae bacterium]